MAHPEDSDKFQNPPWIQDLIDNDSEQLFEPMKGEPVPEFDLKFVDNSIPPILDTVNLDTGLFS